MKRLTLSIFSLLAILFALGGCGQKGPLYHPDDEEAAHEHRRDRYEL